MNSPLKCPFGIDDYKSVSTQCYYVDKTLLAKDIAGLVDGTTTLFTRPRRFGKSLAISMLATFFDEKIKNNSLYFDGKKISLEPEYALMGQFPVIHLSLKEIRPDSFEDLIQQVNDIISREYLRHDELKESNEIYDIDRDYYSNLVRGGMNPTSLSHALFRLSFMLNKHHQKKVCIFIDEYDTPIQRSHEKGFYDEAIRFFQSFYSEALKGNDCLKYAVMTGVLRIAKESLFSDLNNPIVDNGYDSAFQERFGFTKDEARAFADYFVADHSFEELWDWYGGYAFGDEEIMNPWSLISYFRYKKELKEYWTNTSSVSILSGLLGEASFAYSSLLGRLLNNEKVHLKPNFSTSYRDLDHSQEQFVGFLIAAGYLTYSNEDKTLIRIPNIETSLVVRNEILNRYQPKENALSWIDMKNAVMEGDEEAFSLFLKRILLRSFSYFDFNQERSYQAMTLTLISLLFEDYQVKSEVIEGEGRCDIQIQPKEKGRFGAVIEIKHVKSKTSEPRLKDRATAALKQIKVKNYAEDLILIGAAPILAYGIAFYKKTAIVIAEKIR